MTKLKIAELAPMVSDRVSSAATVNVGCRYQPPQSVAGVLPTLARQPAGLAGAVRFVDEGRGASPSGSRRQRPFGGDEVVGQPAPIGDDGVRGGLGGVVIGAFRSRGVVGLLELLGELLDDLGLAIRVEAERRQVAADVGGKSGRRHLSPPGARGRCVEWRRRRPASCGAARAAPGGRRR